MKANRKSLLSIDDRAEVGVGTLIVFIAMVLVAAVAAAVLINTSGTLQQRASQTGKEATEEVSSNLKVIGVYGQRNLSSTDIYNITLNVELAAGAQDLDMTKVVIRYSDGNTTRNYVHDTTAITTTSGAKFNTNWLRGNGANTVMKSGDLVEMKFNLGGTTLAERTEVEILLIPEVGTPVAADFETPATYGTVKTVTLRS